MSKHLTDTPPPPDKVFAVAYTLQPFVGELCWGDACGKGQIGALVVHNIECIPCHEPVCPFVEKESDESIGTDSWERPVYLRKLRQP